MGQPVDLPIGNGFYVSESFPIAAMLSTNCYPNIVQARGLSQQTSLGTPGINELTNTGIVRQINRGMHVKNDIAYAVNGSLLYRIDRTTVDGVDSFGTTALGTITGTGFVDMADNGTQLIILVPGGDAFIYNEDDGTPFQQITDGDFTASGNPLTVEFMDGYFLLTTDQKKVIASAINNGLSYNALDFASAESDPDRISGQVIHQNQQFIFGTQTTEVKNNQGAPSGYPLTTVKGYVFDKGTKSPFSIVKTSGSFMMIGAGVNESPAIWQFTGSGYAKVSTTAIDNILQRATDTQIAEAFAYSYAQKGAFFIAFNFAGRAFFYDEITKLWHERTSIDNELVIPYRVNSLITAYGRVIVADSIDGRIGELDVDLYREYGENIRRIITTANFWNLTGPIRVASVEATIESGVGNSDEPDPQIGISFSDNGGKSFSYERRVSMGKIGEYTKRQIWYKQGRANRMRMWKITMSDPVKFVLISLTANVA